MKHIEFCQMTSLEENTILAGIDMLEEKTKINKENQLKKW